MFSEQQKNDPTGAIASDTLSSSLRKNVPRGGEHDKERTRKDKTILVSAVHIRAYMGHFLSFVRPFDEGNGFDYAERRIVFSAFSGLRQIGNPDFLVLFSDKNLNGIRFCLSFALSGS